MGTWAAPFKTEQAKELCELMMSPLPVGIHNASDKIYNLTGNDDLFDRIFEMHHDEDCRPVVLSFLQGWFGATGDDKDFIEEGGWSDDFEEGALEIIKGMLTEWEVYQRYPTEIPNVGKIIMSASELANYVEGYLKDVAGDDPVEAVKIFTYIFPSATVVWEDGTFTVDMDGKTS